MIRISFWIKILKQAYALTKINEKEQKLKDLKANIAKNFNDHYTYVYEWKDLGKFENNLISKGHAWMCPECNTIHHPISFDSFSGLHYPKCCSTYEGHRLDFNINARYVT